MIIEELCKLTEENHSTLVLATHDSAIANKMNSVLELNNNKLKVIKND